LHELTRNGFVDGVGVGDEPVFPRVARTRPRTPLSSVAVRARAAGSCSAGPVPRGGGGIGWG